MEQVRVGVIGVGMMGSNHVRVLSELDDAKLVAVCDVREENARTIAEKYRCDY